jgi:signal transduction histidine kinase
MRTWEILLILLVAAGLVLVAGCSQPVQQSGNATRTGTPAVTTPSGAAPPGMITPLLLTARVKEAVGFAKENGKEKAVAAFNDPAGRFARDGIYVFAEDYNGTALAEPFEQELVGTDVRTIADRYGIPVVLKIGETARHGTGYVSYDYPDPKKNNAIVPRLAVVADIDGTWYVGADTNADSRMVYPSSLLGPATRPYTVTDLKMFVKEAVAYAKENGKEKALAAFQDKNGRFADGELTIIAADYNGTMVASSISSETANDRINLINYHDPDGVTTIREMRDLAQQGGGYSYTVAMVTKDNRTYYAPKIDYAEPVDSTYWVFSGIIVPEYEQLRTGNLTGITVRNRTRTDLYDLVNHAVTYAKANGKEKTIAEINNPKGQFVQGDLFVWAEDFNGTIMADPYWKEGVGKNWMTYEDPYGAKTTVVGINAIKSGTGFTHAMFPDTAVGHTASVPKLVYARAVDDTWWIGSGIYGVQVG